MNANVSKTNGVKLLAAFAVLAMVVCAFAVALPADETDASSDVITEIGGGIKADDSKFVLTQYTSGEVVVVSDFVIPANTALIVDGAKFTVNENVTITVQAGGQLVFAGDSEVIINGKIVADGKGTAGGTYTYGSAIVNNVTADSDHKGIKVNGSITLLRGAEMDIAAKDSVIGNQSSNSEGVDKYTFDDEITSGTDTGAIILAKSGASLDIQKMGAIISSIDNQTIYVIEGSTFTLNGNANVTVTAYGTATYYTAGSMEVTHTTNGTQKTTSSLTFTVTTQTVTGFTDNNDAESKVTVREYVLNVAGTLNSGDELSIIPGEQVYTGSSSSLTWGSGSKYYAATTNDDGDIVPSDTETLVTKTSITGTLSIAKDGNFTIEDATYTTISGTVSVGYEEDKNNDNKSMNTVAVAGDVVVSGKITMDWGSVADTPGTNSGMLIIDGGSVDITNVVFQDGAIYATNPQIYLYGATYQTENNSVTTLHIRDLDVAITEASAAGVTEVVVYSYNEALSATGAKDAVDKGAYIIDADITIPQGMMFTIAGAVVVEEGASMTFSDGSYTGSVFDAKIYVLGKVVDEAFAFYGQDAVGTGCIVYEVKKVSEDQTVTTYTTLAIALSEAKAGETIELVNKIEISKNLTIPADVTVVTVDDEDAITITNGATLTINGTLELGGTTATIKIDVDSENKADGAIALNGVIADADATKITCTGSYTVTGAYFVGKIGDDETARNYITSVSIAAGASQTVDDADGIVIKGADSLNIGDVTFTEGDDVSEDLVINIEAEKVNAGTVTLVGADFRLSNVNGQFTGTVTTEATAGTVTFDLKKATGFSLTIDSTDDGETVTNIVKISGDSAVQGYHDSTPINMFVGEMILVTGTATFDGTLRINDDAGITVAEGAELIISKDGILNVAADFTVGMFTDLSKYPYNLEKIFTDAATLTVDGTLTVNGQVNWGPVVVNGTMNVADNAEAAVTVDAIVVNGTVALADDKILSIKSAVVNGTITGEINVELFFFAYPGSDLTAAIVDDDGTGASNAEITTFNINGVDYVTVYADASADAPVEIIAIFADVPGTIANTAAIYSDANLDDLIIDLGTTEMKNFDDAIEEYMKGKLGVTSSANVPDLSGVAVGEYDVVYVTMDASSVKGTISQGTGLALYIDNIGYDTYGGELTVGTHTIRIDVKVGYDGANATITFNGQTVENGGTIEITSDMKDFTLVASGAVPADYTGGSSSDGMGLTEILLIILVILIVVMAIMVALRLMRS